MLFYPWRYRSTGWPACCALGSSVFTELFCLALLQEHSVERVKHVLRVDLGAVMGIESDVCQNAASQAGPTHQGEFRQ